MIFLRAGRGTRGSAERGRTNTQAATVEYGPVGLAPRSAAVDVRQMERETRAAA